MARRLVVAVTVVALGWSAGRLVAAQTPASADKQTFTATATAILVDVVVRDHRGGRPVTDLTSDDFAVFEDGVPQKIDSFSRVTRGGGIGVGIRWKTPAPTRIGSASGTEPGEVSAADRATDEGATALVFDHLSEDALHLAQRATLNYVPMNGDSDIRVAVFATEPHVSLLQSFTTDRAAIRKAVARLLPAGTAASDQKAERRQDVVDRRRELLAQTQALAAAAVTGAGGAALAQAGPAMGQTEAEVQLLELERSMIESFDSLDRDHRGYDTTMSLVSVIRSMAEMPGRKSVVFFSEGLPVSPALSARLDDLIAAANRANITVYAVDAHGLRTRSSLTDTRREMQEFVDERLLQTGSGSTATNQPLTMGFERVEDMVRLDSRTGLARLADDTGGFLVEESNDLRSAFRRIDEDNQFHYLLTYSPKNTEFDGKFRAIDVKVHRPGMQVFARKGYRAVRAPGVVHTGSYDVAALALLDRTPLPNAFPVHAAAFSFPDPDRPGLTPVVVHVNTSVFRFDVDPDRSTYSAHGSIVVRIRDENGHEVQRLSQEYVLSGDAKDVDAAKRGDIFFYRESDLPPSVYTMETIVYDALAREGSARVATLTVPSVEPSGIGMSSLVLVNRAETSRDQPPADKTRPLYVGNMLLYPNLGEAIQKSTDAELPFYFTLYGNVHDAKATAELLRNGLAIAQTPLQLPPPTGSRVQEVARMPIGALPAGTYELRIRVTAGNQEVARSAFFTLQ
jgi:VWFA-related protein